MSTYPVKSVTAKFRIYPVKLVPDPVITRRCWYTVQVHATWTVFRTKTRQSRHTRALFTTDLGLRVPVDCWGRTLGDPKGLLGTLHFCVKDLTAGVVAHECMHAVMHLARLTRLELWGPFQREEVLAYNIQHLIEQIERKL